MAFDMAFLCSSVGQYLAGTIPSFLARAPTAFVDISGAYRDAQLTIVILGRYCFNKSSNNDQFTLLPDDIFEPLSLKYIIFDREVLRL